jgi:5'-deoxynucleotidase YfbR-like HD superfamily hydrolase
MINTHLRNIVESADIMRELSNKSLKGRAAFRVARLLRELEKEFTLFNEKRMDLIKEYAQKDENGEIKSDENGNVTLDQDKLNEFYQSLDELLNADVEINAEKIDSEDLGDIEITPAQIINLEAFINE